MHYRGLWYYRYYGIDDYRKYVIVQGKVKLIQYLSPTRNHHCHCYSACIIIFVANFYWLVSHKCTYKSAVLLICDWICSFNAQHYIWRYGNLSNNCIIASSWITGSAKSGLIAHDRKSNFGHKHKDTYIKFHTKVRQHWVAWFCWLLLTGHWWSIQAILVFDGALVNR